MSCVGSVIHTMETKVYESANIDQKGIPASIVLILRRYIAAESLFFNPEKILMTSIFRRVVRAMIEFSTYGCRGCLDALTKRAAERIISQLELSLISNKNINFIFQTMEQLTFAYNVSLHSPKSMIGLN